MTPQNDPASAREQLLAKLQAMPRYQEKWPHDVMARRIAKMTDKQVSAALAMSDEEIEAAARAEPDRYAPPTDPTPVTLWDHADHRWV